MNQTTPCLEHAAAEKASSAMKNFSPTSPWLFLALLAALHFLVDIVAGTTSPMWPILERDLSVETGGLLWVYVCWSMATSFSQLLIGLYADRYPCRWLLWAGPLLGILSISCIGLATSPWGAAALFVMGGLGIAAFHPEGAAMAGALFPQQRSRAMAIFAFCGYLGQSAGPYYCGVVADRFGLDGLVWGIAWGAPLLLLLWLGLRKAPAVAVGRRADVLLKKRPVQNASVQHTPQTRLPWGAVGLLLAVGALRILPALGVPLALAYLLEASSGSSSVVGAVQSAFMGGIGLGAMACAAFLKHRWERTALWLFPLLATPLLAVMALGAGWLLVLMVGVCGLLLGVTMPVYISYGQQLLPHGQRVASSITMGVSWGIGGALVAAAMAVFQAFDALPSIFLFFAAAALASSLLCHLLPTIAKPQAE